MNAHSERVEPLTLVAITPEAPVPDEAAKVTGLLEGGWGYVHLRHPGADEATMRRLLEDIPARLRARLKLHDRHVLAREYGAGVHFNSRNPYEASHLTEGGALPRGSALPCPASASCHSTDEVAEVPGELDYVTLSPVYSSISKRGYEGVFTPGPALREALRGHRVVALGGVTPARLRELAASGFMGAAMLGAIPWERDTEAVKAFATETVKLTTGTTNMTTNLRYMLQFITDGPAEAIPDQVWGALRGGVRWVQLRMKEATPAEVTAMGRRLIGPCRVAGATLIINDHPEVAKAVGADGVHLGKTDMAPSEARKLLGPRAIIGATANSLSDVERLMAEPVNYLGIGPYRFTGTKKNLAPLLGVEGYREIIGMMKARNGGEAFPHVAIGGITAADIAGLAEAGVSGFAVSGAIAHAADPAGAAREILEAIAKINTNTI